MRFWTSSAPAREPLERRQCPQRVAAGTGSASCTRALRPADPLQEPRRVQFPPGRARRQRPPTRHNGPAPPSRTAWTPARGRTAGGELGPYRQRQPHAGGRRGRGRPPAGSRPAARTTSSLMSSSTASLVSGECAPAATSATSCRGATRAVVAVTTRRLSGRPLVRSRAGWRPRSAPVRAARTGATPVRPTVVGRYVKTDANGDVPATPCQATLRASSSRRSASASEVLMISRAFPRQRPAHTRCGRRSRKRSPTSSTEAASDIAARQHGGDRRGAIGKGLGLRSRWRLALRVPALPLGRLGRHVHADSDRASGART